MIVFHFTPSAKRWKKTLWESTGNVESILEDGLRQFSSVAYGPLDEVFEFAHHAQRNNRKGLWGRILQPAVVMFEYNGPMQQGYDGEYHLQINDVAQNVIGWFEFESFDDFKEKTQRRI